ncbi:MAG: hypothetical protein JJ920_10405 [Roseitalea sp.]|jgi:protein ImuA|nr:hypothetical protein [Roseitalea sp.]MBO6721557.1 hypothetical protein [Roseitalea sp.]MBO6743313.1 hypothetical protein [Roseitalea sp.]
MQTTLIHLQRRIEALAPAGQRPADMQDLITLGDEQVDATLGAALVRGALHELYAAGSAHAAALTGFCAGLARCITSGTRKTVWIRQTFSETEAGHLFMPGLAALGFDPATIIHVQTRRSEDGLRAALEAVRCASLGAVVIELWGNPKSLDLTATRRLTLAAEASGVTPLLLRVAAEPGPSVARTRWQVAAAPSSALAANAPGKPAFDITLLRNRAGASGQRWHLEWDHERKHFRQAAALSGGVAAIPDQRPVPASVQRFARAV